MGEILLFKLFQNHSDGPKWDAIIREDGSCYFKNQYKHEDETVPSAFSSWLREGRRDKDVSNVNAELLNDRHTPF